MRVKLTPAFVRHAQPPAAGRLIYWDTSLPNFGLRLTSNGHRSYVAQYRANGISRRHTIKGTLSLADARKEALAALGAAAKGRDPVAERRKARGAEKNTLKAITEEYVAREGKRLRTMEERRKTLERLVYPKFGSRQIDSIRRNEIVRLLDRIEDESGPVMADRCLAYLRRVLNWHAARSDDFRSAIVRGMGRSKSKERARKRTLSDDELRIVWRVAAHVKDPFSNLIRFILLQATRKSEAAKMQRSELTEDGRTLEIPGSRHKSKQDFLLPLSKKSRALLAEIPVIGRRNAGYVFTFNGKKPINGFSKSKAAFNELVLAELRQTNPQAKPFPNWTLHDLRRTARSLMSRAGADADHAELALGHVLPGVRGVYDRHAYWKEKLAVFEALASQIERIVNPQENVVMLREGR